MHTLLKHISERTNLAQLLSILLSTLLHAPLSALPGLSSVDRTSECTTLCLLSTRSGTPLSTLPGRNTERTPTRPLIDCNQVTARIAHPPMCQQKRSMYSTLCHLPAAIRAPPPQNHLKTTCDEEPKGRRDTSSLSNCKSAKPPFPSDKLHCCRKPRTPSKSSALINCQTTCFSRSGEEPNSTQNLPQYHPVNGEEPISMIAALDTTCQ